MDLPTNFIILTQPRSQSINYSISNESEIMKNNPNSNEIKQVMRSWITGVAIVTGFHNDNIHGMTANSFNSIALDPPIVMVALRQNTRTQQLVRAGGVFAISILNHSQQRLAERFAGQIEQDQPRFLEVDTFTLQTGAPLIQSALAYMDCKVIHYFDVGDTTVFLGEVLQTQMNTIDHDPLLYLNQQWRRLAE